MAATKKQLQATEYFLRRLDKDGLIKNIDIQPQGCADKVNESIIKEFFFCYLRVGIEIDWSVFMKLHPQYNRKSMSLSTLISLKMITLEYIQKFIYEKFDEPLRDFVKLIGFNGDSALVIENMDASFMGINDLVVENKKKSVESKIGSLIKNVLPNDFHIIYFDESGGDIPPQYIEEEVDYLSLIRIEFEGDEYLEFEPENSLFAYIRVSPETEINLMYHVYEKLTQVFGPEKWKKPFIDWVKNTIKYTENLDYETPVYDFYDE